MLVWMGGIASGLTSCLDTNGGGNYQSFPAAPVVVNHNPEIGGPSLLTTWGEIAAPELTQFSQGDCLFAQFTIDYDNQPSSLYYTATDVSYSNPINVANADIVADSVAVGDYTLPITAINISPYNNPLLLNGRFFFQMKNNAVDNQSIEYKLLTSEKEVDNNGVYTMYLVAKQDDSSGTKVDVTRNQVFLINNLLLTLGKDTTINTNVRVKYLKVDLKYYTQQSDSAPFTDYGNIELAIYN